MVVSSAGLLVGEPVRILVAEDEDTLRTVITRVLDHEGYDVTAVASGEEALAAFEHRSYPLVITDIVMGGLSGLDLLKELKRRVPDVHASCRLSWWGRSFERLSMRQGGATRSGKEDAGRPAASGACPGRLCADSPSCQRCPPPLLRRDSLSLSSAYPLP